MWKKKASRIVWGCVAIMSVIVCILLGISLCSNPEAEEVVPSLSDSNANDILAFTEAKTEESSEPVEILCQVSKEDYGEGKKTVLVSWTYEEMNYVIFGEIPKDSDEAILAKTAVYVTDNF